MKIVSYILSVVLVFNSGLVGQTTSPNPPVDPLGLGAQPADTQAPVSPGVLPTTVAPQNTLNCDSEADPNCQTYTGAPSTPAVTPSTVQEPSAAGTSNGQPASRNSAQTHTTPESQEQLTEFQELARSSTGKLLPIFGSSFFSGVPTTFAQVDVGVPVASDYIIGPGDELYIQISGQINMARAVPVDRSGEIYLPKIGTIPVAGVRFGDLPGYLNANIGRVFRNFDLAVTLGKLRSIQVLVVGHAKRPGSYTVSSLSTLTNAVFASGGPSSRGSMRRIQLRRANRVVTEFDLYDLLLGGDKSKDVFLQNGDVIFIETVGPQVAVSGSVNVPAIYELKGASDVGSVVAAAGGLTSMASTHKAVIERIEKRTARVVREITLDTAGLQFSLQDGDIIRVLSIIPRFENAITLRGNVAEPGRYPWHLGMRIRDLIPTKDFLLTRNFWQNQNQLGESPAVSPSAPQARVTPEQLQNQIKRSAPEINWDYAVIQRVKPEDLTTSLIPFNLGKAVIENDESQNIVLQPGDVVTIFSQNDLTVPSAKKSKFIRLEGEFVAPGIYQAGPDESLRSLVERAGGFTKQAYVFGAQLTRESARIEQQQSIDELVHNMDAEVQQSISASAGSADAATLAAQTQYQRALVDRFRQIRPIGRVVLEIHPTDTGTGSLPEIALEDGDRLFVPNHPTTISVVGSVYNPNSFIFRKGTKVGNYLDLAGKGTRNADLKNSFIIRADGSVVSRRTQSGFWSGGLDSARALPGDVIVVPVKLNRGAWIRALRDWSQLASQLALTGASIAVIAK